MIFQGIIKEYHHFFVRAGSQGAAGNGRATTLLLSTMTYLYNQADVIGGPL